jgi:purine nucleosidase
MKMILDLDTGIDDALALAYVIGIPKIDLIGIVASYGNVMLEDGVRNTSSLLHMLGRSDIPVYKGAAHALMEKSYSLRDITRFIHGENGIGNINITEVNSQNHKKDGVDFIIESVKKYGKDLVIVPTGPLTNLALALRKAPEIKELIGNVVFMGGALTVPGNVSLLAEANIYRDAEAADEVFTSGIPLTMVGLDVTRRTIFTSKDTKDLRNLNTNKSIAYADMIDYYISSYKVSEPDLNGCALHDPLAVAVAVMPDLVSTHSMFMRIGTRKEDYGRTIGDVSKLKNSNPNMKVSLNVDVEKFTNHFKESLMAALK